MTFPPPQLRRPPGCLAPFRIREVFLAGADGPGGVISATAASLPADGMVLWLLEKGANQFACQDRKNMVGDQIKNRSICTVGLTSTGNPVSGNQRFSLAPNKTMI